MTFPQLRTALLAGGLLAFALSFDEVVVTIFTSGAQQTLPIWIFANLFRPIELPIVNVVALFVIVVSIIPVYIATADRRGDGADAGARREGGRRGVDRDGGVTGVRRLTPLPIGQATPGAAEPAVAVRVPREVLLVVRPRRSRTARPRRSRW